MTDDSETGRDAETALPAPGWRGRFGGLSGKLLRLTVVCILLAEVLFFFPSLANMRLRWLSERLNAAAAAAIVIDGLQPVDLPRALQRETLMATGTKAIVLRKDGTTRLLAMSEMPTSVDAQYDIAEVPLLQSVSDALDTLIFGGKRLIRVSGPLPEIDAGVEVVMKDGALHRAMLSYARNVFVLSILIALFTAVLVFFALDRILIRPIRELTGSMRRFSADPEDPTVIFAEEKGEDELALAGRHLAAMQRELQKVLKQQKNLAALGLAVSKINHDMRNILASAQLISDRLADADDPLVKRFAPKLLRTIDRAVGYTTEVLSFGQASEQAPRRRRFALAELVDEVRDLLAIDPGEGIEFAADIEPQLEIDADSEQLFRVIHNLCRNALQAMAAAPAGEGAAHRRIAVSAQRLGSVVGITIDDNGPGMPDKARQNLFAAFKGSARSGGTGLGLPIARELVLAHGGTIALVEKPTPGTQFRIEIPDRAVPIDQYRERGLRRL